MRAYDVGRKTPEENEFCRSDWFKSSGKRTTVDEHLIYKESPKNEKS